MINIESITVGAFQENTYIIWDDKTKSAYIIDPGGENNLIFEVLKKNELKVLAIINTHGHIDHIAGVKEIQDKLNVPFKVHEDDKALVEQADVAAGYFGIQAPGIPTISGFLKEGESLPLGNHQIEIIHTPGHSPGGVCMKIGDKAVIVGDTLFAMSIGRTDLPGGSHKTLINSIKQKLFVLADSTKVFPGHGPATTIGYEKQNNPFLS